MKTLLMLKGLPGSGKTTWAKDLQQRQPGKWKRINRDDLRAMFDDSRWSKERERFLLDIQSVAICHAFDKGLSVIIDDTNLDPKCEKRLRQIITNSGHQANFQIEDFTNVDLQLCLKRNADRTGVARVPETVIHDMHQRYLAKPEPGPPFSPDFPTLPPATIAGAATAIIVDMDGTLALNDGHRGHFDWDKVGGDKLNVPVATIVKAFEPYTIIVVSGRKDVCREQTFQWLVDKRVPCDFLFMRKAADNRPDEIVKAEIYRSCIQGRFNILFVLDDRDKVVKMWRAEGLPCFQVAPGAF